MAGGIGASPEAVQIKVKETNELDEMIGDPFLLLLQTPEGSDWLTLFQGPFALLVFVLVSLYLGMKRVWVFGREYDALLLQIADLRRDYAERLQTMEEERNEWKQQALRSLVAATTAVKLASEVSIPSIGSVQ